MSALLYPVAYSRLVTYQTGTLTDSLGLILHVQQGNGSLAGYFSNPANGAMSHWWVSKTGAVEQYADARAASWAQKAGNSSYHSVETEGWTTEPLTGAQIDALAGLCRWGRDTLGWPLQLADRPGERGFGWHGMGGVTWGNHPGCPGDLRKAQRATVLAKLAPVANTKGKTAMVLVRDPITGRIYLQGCDTVLHYIATPAAVRAYQALGVPGPGDVDQAVLKTFEGFKA